MRHQWIFSGAIETMTLKEEGAIAQVVASGGELIGHAYFNSRSDIIGRMVSLGDEDPLEALDRKVREAADLRKSTIDFSKTKIGRAHV